MLKNCMKLFYIHLLRLFSINELRYTKDKKKKTNAILMLCSFIILGSSLIVYVGILAYSICLAGMPNLVPTYMLAVTSALIMVFTIFKAGSIMFGAKDYEQLISLPLNTSTIVISRFLTMYISNLLFAVVTMLPSTIIYSMFVSVGIEFYLMIIISVLFIPLIPMTIATTIGVIITAISSKMKHKTLFTVVFALVATLGIMLFSMGSGNIDQAMLSDLSVTMTKQINHIYPISPIYTSAIVHGNILAFLEYILLSVATFTIFAVIVSWKYVSINSALTSRSTKSNYVLTELKTASPLQALYKKELRRYLSSALYILNTGIGYVLMIIMSVAIFFVGPDKLETTLQIPGLKMMLITIAPLIISTMACITSTTVSSISLEGKQWWIAVSLPVNTKAIFDSKILVNLTLAIPSSLISSTLFAITLPIDIFSFIFLFITPIAYILFISVLGITINANMPSFNWDNEAYAIKQSAATLVAMLIGMISFAIPFILIFSVKTVSANIIIMITTIILFGITALLYAKNNKMSLKTLQESK